MSVKLSYRRNGFGKRMLQSLEEHAKVLEYKKVVLETNNDWESALNFYTSNGYQMVAEDGECMHFEKFLS
ncbi:GNAT family N-acetyltransferase [Halobacillus naozhouensis]|uniref:GNAT family N-acetyltransferase n=1 Tax=Halobacillus naozhouensis TaxID=554880 RepID=A0ABY8J6G0_9BACI|nr:GNAT family N-acetyltransferase [Halobacillus naozhouensis]WFT76355.1 GNAT family N-acetyltransferase [Halobacillus naozhouensis]